MEILTGEIEGLAGALMLAALLSVPFLGGILIVGLLLSILQAATQIQEQTLTFVPKLGVIGVMLYLGGGWFLGQLSSYLTFVLDSLPEISRNVAG